MIKYIYNSIIVIITVAFLSPLSLAQAPRPPELKITGTEYIAKMSELTSLTKDTVSLIHKEYPELFDPLEKYLHHLKLFDLLLNAKDADAAFHAISPVVNKYIDVVLKAFYPSNFLTFIKVVKVYNGILKLIRDTIFIPRLEKELYKRYRNSRNQNSDKYTAIGEATVTGYFPAKPKIYQQFLKAKGINKKLLSKKLADHYWKQIDHFWMNRLEALYQYELFKKNYLKIDLAVHKKLLPHIDAIRKKAVNRSQEIGAHCFISLPNDLPDGWWWHKERPASNYNGKAEEVTRIRKVTNRETGQIVEKKFVHWAQYFYISMEKGFKYNKGRWNDTTKRNRRCSKVKLSILIDESVYKTDAQRHKFIKHYKKIRKDYIRIIGKKKQAAIGEKDTGKTHRIVEFNFFKGPFRIQIRLDGDKESKSVPSESIAQFFGRKIWTRIKKT